MKDQQKLANVGEALRYVRKSRKLTLEQVASATGSNPANLSRVETGKQEITQPRLAALCRVLNITPQELYALIEEPNPPPIPVRPLATWDIPDNLIELPHDQHVLIPRLHLSPQAACGWVLDKRKPIAARMDMLPRIQPHGLAALVAQGDAMRPRICDGDTLLVDTQANIAIDTSVYAIKFVDAIRITRVFANWDGGLILRPDNREASPEITVPPTALGNTVAIIGRVILVIGPVE